MSGEREWEPFYVWLDAVRAAAATLPHAVLDGPSPWVGLSIRDSLEEAHDACWIDRCSAGETPQEALDDAVRSRYWHGGH